MSPEFLRRKSSAAKRAASEAVGSPPLSGDITAQEYQLKLYYAGKSSAGVRFKAGPRTIDEIPTMLAGIATSDVELVEPLPIEAQS